MMKLIQQIRVRPRLLIAIALGAISSWVLPAQLGQPARTLIAWNLGAGLYVILAWQTMCRATIATMRKRARDQDDGAIIMLGLTLIAALTSLAAIVLELSGVKGYPHGQQALHLILAGLTIVVSWSLVHTSFALHYAHEFYLYEGEFGQKPLQFPEQPAEPGYGDFLYFSFVIGTTCQTADVNITAGSMRRLALMHGIVTFFFNTALLALGINIAAGLI
jgi:uncharacterized membrane protein